jgi:hypothetical protein
MFCCLLRLFVEKLNIDGLQCVGAGAGMLGFGFTFAPAFAFHRCFSSWQHRGAGAKIKKSVASRLYSQSIGYHVGHPHYVRHVVYP